MRVTYLVIEYYETARRTRTCCLQTTVDCGDLGRTRSRLCMGENVTGTVGRVALQTEIVADVYEHMTTSPRWMKSS